MELVSLTLFQFYERLFVIKLHLSAPIRVICVIQNQFYQIKFRTHLEFVVILWILFNQKRHVFVYMLQVNQILVKIMIQLIFFANLFVFLKIDSMIDNMLFKCCNVIYFSWKAVLITNFRVLLICGMSCNKLSILL